MKSLDRYAILIILGAERESPPNTVRGKNMKFIDEYKKKQAMKKYVEPFDFESGAIRGGIPSNMTLEFKYKLADKYMKIYTTMCDYEKDSPKVREIATRKICQAIKEQPELVRITSRKLLNLEEDPSEYWEHSLGLLALDKGYLDVVEYILDTEAQLIVNDPTCVALRVRRDNLAAHCAMKGHPELAISVIDNPHFRLDYGTGHYLKRASLTGILCDKYAEICPEKGIDLGDSDANLGKRYLDAIMQAVEYEDVLMQYDQLGSATIFAHTLAKEWGDDPNFEPIIKKVLDLESEKSGKIRENLGNGSQNMMDYLISRGTPEMIKYIKDRYDYEHSDYLERREQERIDFITNKITNDLELADEE